MPNVVDDGHDWSSRKIPLPSAPLLVFFTGRYLVLGKPCLVQRTIIDGDKIITGLGPKEASKSRMSSCYLFVLHVFDEMVITMWLGL